MSGKKHERVIRVDNLIIHAENVEFNHDRRRKDDRRDDENRRDPWDFFWGRPRALDVEEKEEESSEHKDG